ncbi:MAG: hypothetical protein AB7O24_33615 [Kofleriaceae bacterium]
MKRLRLATPTELVVGSFALERFDRATVNAFIKRLGEDRELRAHIVLPWPIANPLALGGPESPASRVLGISDYDIRQIAMYEKAVVLAPGPTDQRAGDILDELACQELAMDPDFEFATGPAAIAALLEERHAPVGFVLRALPLVPVALQPNLFYPLSRRVVAQLVRVQSLLATGTAPEMFLRNEITPLLGHIEAMFANGRENRVYTDPESGDVLLSLSDLLANHGVDAAAVFAGTSVDAEPSPELEALLRAAGMTFA